MFDRGLIAGMTARELEAFRVANIKAGFFDHVDMGALGVESSVGANKYDGHGSILVSRGDPGNS